MYIPKRVIFNLNFKFAPNCEWRPRDLLVEAYRPFIDGCKWRGGGRREGKI